MDFTATLKAVLSPPSPQRERVDKTREALAAANANAHEPDDSISIAGDVPLGVDDNADEVEVEVEWAEPIRHQQARRRRVG